MRISVKGPSHTSVTGVLAEHRVPSTCLPHQDAVFGVLSKAFRSCTLLLECPGDVILPVPWSKGGSIPPARPQVAKPRLLRQRLTPIYEARGEIVRIEYVTGTRSRRSIMPSVSTMEGA